jgi:hypothetical protein
MAINGHQSPHFEYSAAVAEMPQTRFVTDIGSRRERRRRLFEQADDRVRELSSFMVSAVRP